MVLAICLYGFDQVKDVHRRVTSPILALIPWNLTQNTLHRIHHE